MNRVWALPLLALLLFSGSPPAGAQDPPEGAPWWPDAGSPDDFRDAWNFRVPIRVDAPAYDLPAGSPARVHIDLGRAAIDAGWPSEPGSNGPVPRAFTLDLDAIRLVEYTKQWAEIKTGGAGAASVPVMVSTGWDDPHPAEADGRQQLRPYHNETNPKVTLEWLLPHALEVEESAYYYIYYDIKQNSDRDAQPLPDDAREALDAQYWTGRGVELLGHVEQGVDNEPDLFVYGTEDATDFTVYTDQGGGWVEHSPDQGSDPPFALDAGEARAYALGPEKASFRIEATRPVIALQKTPVDRIGSSTFVPAVDGGHTGQGFLVPHLAYRVMVIAPTGPVDGTAYCFHHSSESCDQEFTVAPGGYRMHTLSEPQSCPAARQGVRDPASPYVLSVQDGPPVMVTYAPHYFSASFYQVPSDQGSPVGQAFQAPTVKHSNGRYYATAWTDGLELWVPELPQAEKTYALNEEGVRTVLFGSDFPATSEQTCNNNAVETQPMLMEVRTTDEGEKERGFAQLSAGYPTSTQSIAQSNPFGGRHGESFHARGPFVAQPFYNDTRITLQPDGGVPLDVLLDAGASQVWSAEGAVFVQADKPISVLPLEADRNVDRFLAAVPDFPPVEVLGGEYQGYIVSVSPASGNDPHFVDGAPGDTVLVPFNVQNLGRWAGVTLGDTILLEVDTGSEDVDIDPVFLKDGSEVGVDEEGRAELELPHGSPVPVGLELQIPDDLPDDQRRVVVNVVGTSKNNPTMSERFTVIVFSKVEYDVDAWFGSLGSTDRLTLLDVGMEVGQTRVVPFVVRNLGSGEDVFRFDLPPLSGGWTAQVLDAEDGPVEETSFLAPGASESFGLRLSAPSGDQSSSVVVPLDIVSEGSSVANMRLSVFPRLSLGTDLELEVDGPLRTVAPGASTTYGLVVRNTGNDTVNVDFQLLADPPTGGWDVEVDEVDGDLALADHALAPRGQVGSEHTVKVKVTVPDDAPAGERMSLLARVHVVGDAGVRSDVPLAVLVGDLDRMEYDVPPEIAVLPGANVTVSVVATNDGNGQQNVTVRPASLPAGWDLTSGALLLDAGETKTLDLLLDVPSDAPPGGHQVAMTAITANGHRQSIETTVSVASVRTVTWETPSPVPMRPGEEGARTVWVANDGNLPLDLSLSVEGPEGWVVAATPESARVFPDQKVPVLMEWSVPADVDTGDYALRLVADDGDGLHRSPETGVSISEVGLVMEDVKVFDAAKANSVAFVQVRLRNTADASSGPIELRLHGGDRVLDAVPVQAVGAGQEAVVVLSMAVDEWSVEGLTVLWGIPGEGGSFEEIGRQGLDVGDVGTERTTSAGTVLGALLLLAAITVARRGRP